MTAERAESMNIRNLELVLVTPEARPLAVFGTAVSDVVSNRLSRAGVRVYCNSLAKVPATRRLLIAPGADGSGIQLADVVEARGLDDILEGAAGVYGNTHGASTVGTVRASADMVQPSHAPRSSDTGRDEVVGLG